MIKNAVLLLYRLKGDDIARHGLMMAFFGVLTSFFVSLSTLYGDVAPSKRIRHPP